MTHELKIWPEHFDAVASGHKTVELRTEDDRHFAVGDVLVLREGSVRPVHGLAWSPEKGTHDITGRVWEYTGRSCQVVVTHVLRDPDARWLQPGVVALSIRLMPDGGEDNA